MSIFSELDAIREQAHREITRIVETQCSLSETQRIATRNDIDQALVQLIMDTCNVVLVP